jgi:enamine deaminase RidA (YjgF/YER057c/UK114 family)
MRGTLAEYTTKDVVICWEARRRSPNESNGADVALERTAVNPVKWSVGMGFNQGEVVSGHSRTLYCSGQTAMSDDGQPQHDGDMAAQLALSLDNLEAVLGEAGMSLADLVRVNVYTTDVDLLFQHYGVLASRLGAAGVAPTTTMLGVTRLAIPGQLVELEGTAVA